MQPTADLLRRITTDPRVLGSKPTVRGLRISAEQLLKALAAGHTVADLLYKYPELEQTDIQVVLLFAADAIREQRIYRLLA